MDNGFMFGTRATWDFPICKVEQYPEISMPVRRFESYTIPGRSGTLHAAESAFEAITKSYSCYFHAEDFVPDTAHEIASWLSSRQGQQRLIDAYDQEHFFLASVLTETSFENWMGKYSRFKVTFTCDPRAFLVSGDNPILFPSSGAAICNPCAFPAQPIITVYGSGAGELTVGGTTVGILGFAEDITLDCEDMDAYRVADGLLVNCNGLIYAPEFPVLQPGENVVSWSGGIDHVEIIPRWWTL